jgi:hypothetical protein
MVDYQSLHLVTTVLLPHSMQFCGGGWKWNFINLIHFIRFVVENTANIGLLLFVFLKALSCRLEFVESN